MVLRELCFVTSITSVMLFSAHASDSTSEQNCAKFTADVKSREYLDADEQQQWLASPHVWRSFLWENDGFAPPGLHGDRHYTNGVKLSWLHNPCRGKHQWLEAVWRSLHSEDASATNDYYTGGVFGMNMYTPRNLDEPARQRFDRPYVGWLYGGFQVQVQKHPVEKKPVGIFDIYEGMGSSAIELQLGLVGPHAGQGQVQTWIHRDWGASSHIGHWENQVHNFFGVNALYKRSRNYWLDPNKHLRATLFGGGNVGNLTNFVNAGFVLAYGNPGEGLIAATTIQPAIKTMEAQVTRTRPPSEWAVFVGIDQRHIWNSVFVQGKGDERHDLSLVRNVHDLFWGITAQIWKEHSVGYKHFRRSLEFRSSEPRVMLKHDVGQFFYEMRF